jgi:deoxycytidylate deaminase
MKRPSKTENIALNSVINKWTIMSLPYIKINLKSKKTRYVDVKCKCGVLKSIKVASLINGTSSGCGHCGNRYARTDEQLKTTSINNIFLDYKGNAKARNYDFNLTLDEFKGLIFQNCFYCDASPANIQKNKHTIVKYNGIDRLDNSIGYQTSNCVTSCATCNTMKLDYSATHFLEQIQRIVKNNKFNQTNNPISEKKLKIYHDRAVVIASQSHDIHTKVAALLIDPKTLAVTAEGFNGFVRGGPDSSLPTSRPEKYNYIIHAETNLLCNAVRSGVKTGDCILYCTLSPCTKCIRMLWQAGISEFYFKEKYSDFEDSSAMLDLEINCSTVGDFYHLQIKPRTS